MNHNSNIKQIIYLKQKFFKYFKSYLFNLFPKKSFKELHNI